MKDFKLAHPDGSDREIKFSAYLKQLLLTLWAETENFRGKAPFGNSGWDWDIYRALVKEGLIDGETDEDGCLDDFDQEAGDKYISEFIHHIFKQGDRVKKLELESQRLQVLFDSINTPQTANFLEAVENEAKHQKIRWGKEHDEVKTDVDWIWLLGYLVGKATHATTKEKKLHHIITIAAACMNWHEQANK